jgi:succinate dehydrogenase/fumarate reductase cytochrome b subunit
VINHILNDIVYRVDWALYFQITSGVILLGIVHRVFGFSPVHVALELIKEIFSVITNPAITKKSIDATLTCAMILFILVVVLSFAMHGLVGEYVTLLRSGVEREGQSAFLVVILIFLLGVVGILSLKYTDWRED